MTKLKTPVLHNPLEKHFNVIAPYQYYVFFLLFLCKLPLFWHALSLIFLSPPIDFHCNTTEVKNGCPCNDPSWDRSVFSQTMQTKFDLFCDRSWLTSFSHSMLYLGSLCGSLLFGLLSDKFGRLPMFALTCLIVAMFGCISTVMPTVAAFTFIRFLEGIGIGGNIVTSYVLCVEYCGLRNREIVTALFHIPMNLGHISLAGVSYLLRNSDDYQLAISIPLFFCVGMYWLINESPKWLMDNGYIDKAASVIERVSRFQRSSSGTIKQEIEEYLASRAKSSQHQMRFWEIFRHKTLSINLACMAFVYFTCGMGYYGVSQYIGQMSGNIHTNVAISGALLIPGTLLATVLLVFLARKPFLMASMFLSGALMLIVVFLPSECTWARVIIACICNCCFFISFIIVFLYGVELFPTTVRNSALGFLAVMARVGQITAPSVNNLSQTVSGAVFGASAIIAAIICYMLPETKNTELPSSLEDTKILSRKKVSMQSNTEANVEIS